jgi:GT2 family glycosyltransferase
MTASILALCATFNRCDVTLAALDSLRAQELPLGARLSLAVVDDASSDGTLAAVRERVPNALTASTEGGLYWAGTMRMGYALFWDPGQYSHLLVFNDDCVFYPGALVRLLAVAEAAVSPAGVIAVAAFRDVRSGTLTYGGLRRRPGWPAVYLDRVAPGSEPLPLDTCNMNLTLISAACLARNELIGREFTHSLADFDFGLRASRNGATVLLAPGFLGECSRNRSEGTWEDSSLPIRRRWRLMHQPKGLPVRPRLHYLRSHAPYTWLPIFVWPYFRLALSHAAGSAKRLASGRRGIGA